MSVDFATLQGLTIPQGVVTEIKDSLGRVLWNAVKMANLTITSFWDGMDGDSARIIITSPSPFAPNPNEPNNKVTSWTAYVYDLFDQQNRTIKIPVGSTIECYITRDKGNAESYIKLNNVSVITGEGTYVYTVTGDTSIDVSEDYIQGDFGVISIVGAVTYISFTMNGTTYQAIEGMSWSAWFASSYNTTGETEGTVKDANGNEVSMSTVIVGGAVYEVEFVQLCKVRIKPYPVQLMGNNVIDANVKVTINGVSYDGSNEVELNVEVGTKMECYMNTTNRGCSVTTPTGNTSLITNTTANTYNYTIQKDTLVLIGGYMIMAFYGQMSIYENCSAFYINKILYSYQIGMSWNDHIGSEFNNRLPESSRLTISNGVVYSVGKQLYLNGVAVKASDPIIELGLYTNS